MDIAIVGPNSIRLKGKNATFIIDPASPMPKVQADGVILLNERKGIDVSMITDFRIIIDGPGSYEVGGVKISGLRTPKGILYRFLIDGVNIIAGKTTEVKDDGFDECQVAIINADDDFSESSVTAMEPKIVVLYGDKKNDAAKKLGAENLAPATKITVIKDKFPEKMEVVVLASS